MPSSGFRIAEEDLRIRGPGDFAGVRQSGIHDLVFADLVRDAPILQLAKEIAAELQREDPSLSAPDHVGIQGLILRRQSIMTPSFAGEEATAPIRRFWSIVS